MTAPILLENLVANLGKDIMAPDLPLANDRPGPLGICILDLSGDAVAVEDGVGKIARRQAVARPDDGVDALVAPFAAPLGQAFVELAVRLTRRAEDHRVA